MKILVCDDEPLARSRLIQHLQKLDGFKVIGEAANGVETLELCEKLSPDVVLLDIRMPAMDGMEAAQHLSRFENPPAIIFTTAYDQHVLKAFETNATGYLLKPVRQEQLVKALNKARKVNLAQLNAMGEADVQNHKRTHICARQRGNLILVPVHEIIYFHADQKYVAVATKDYEVLIEESLKSIEMEFAGQFIRIHRATLVAPRYIQSLEKSFDGSHKVKLLNCQREFTVSRRLLPELRKALKRLKAG